MKTLNDLRGKNIVIFDTEIKNTIEQAGGWKKYDKMGVSVACLFDYRDGDNKVYLDDNIAELGKRLTEADVISGFNILGFDIPLLEATIPGLSINKSKVFDLLQEVRIATGWTPGSKYFPKGCNLNEVLSATFGMQKTEDGADAPLFFQRGEIGKLTTYCLADVRRERIVFEQAYLKGEVRTATNGIHKICNVLDRFPSLGSVA